MTLLITIAVCQSKMGTNPNDRREKIIKGMISFFIGYHSLSCLRYSQRLPRLPLVAR